MRVRPTRRLFGPLQAAFVLHLLARATGGSWLALGSSAALALPLAALLARPALSEIEVSLRHPARATVGTRVSVVVTARNSGRRSFAGGTWEHTHPGFEPQSVSIPALAAGATVQVTTSRIVTRRGLHTKGSGRLTSSAPFGLLRWSTPPAVGTSVLTVHPQLVPVRSVPVGGTSAAIDRSLPVPGSGAEVLGLRPWRQGDGARAVSARASARHDRPVVLERERETGATLVVLAVGGGAGDAWERGVSMAASLSVEALREGSPPLLIAAPPGPHAPRRADAGGVLDFFAGIDAAGPLRNIDVKTALRAVGPGGTLVLLAPPGAFEHTIAVRRAAEAARCRVVTLGG